MRFGRAAAILIAVGALAACKAGQDYRLPVITLPAAWQPETPMQTGGAGTPVEGEYGPREAWWKGFHDPLLDQLMTHAEAGNQDLKMAAARVKEARTLRRIAAASLYPNLNVRAGSSRGNQGNIFNNKAITLHDAAFDANWELDLFGGARREEEAAEAGIAAREAAEKAALLTLRAEVARVYVEIRSLQRQIELLRNTASSQQETAGLTRSLERAGLASGIDQALAETEAQAAAARVPVLEVMLQESRHELAVLLGITPDVLDKALDEAAPVPVMASEMVLDTPARVIARRPDVMEKERELASATALTAAAIADTYPHLSLSGVFGIRNTSLAGGSSLWSMGVGVMQPIFDSGRLQAAVDQADAREEEALHAYEKSVLQAVAEVENALTAYAGAEQQRLSLEAAVDAARRGEDLTAGRYQKGIASYYEVLQARRLREAQELTLVQTREAVAQASIRVYKSLAE